MILGKIIGKVSTTRFSFHVDNPVKKFDYVQVLHSEYGYVLCQIVDITKSAQADIADCLVIGYSQQDGQVQVMKDPFEPDSPVLKAQEAFISQIVKLSDTASSAFLGKLEGTDINVKLDLQKLLTKHVAILAKSGAGKSYCVGVLLEEIIQKGIPLLIIDPHGEYETLKEKSTDSSQLARFGLKPAKFAQQISVYADLQHKPSAKPLYITDQLSAQELLAIMPAKLSAAQEGLLYAIIQQTDVVDFDHLIYLLQAQESNAKYHILQMIDVLKNYNIFSKSSISYNELIQGSKCSIIDLKGINPEVQQIIVYKLLKDLFELRKKDKIPPFFCVVEEAHNFCPERSFGQVLTSPVLRTIASEGRKFGMGLCIVSQRPARVDKSVLSQVSTQIILKVTNPNDLKALAQSVEAMTSETENAIQNLPIGHALVTGVVDVPLFVQIRPRMTKHGGQSVNMVAQTSFLEQLETYEAQEILPLIFSLITKEDRLLMAQKGHLVRTTLRSCALFLCNAQPSFWLLVDRINGRIYTDVNEYISAKLPQLEKLSTNQLTTLKKAYELQSFTFEQYLQKSGANFDVQQILDSLVELEYLQKQENTYKITNEYALSQLKRFAVTQKIMHLPISFDQKLEAVLSLDVLKEQLTKFCTVSDVRDCYLVVYDIVHE